MGNLHPSLGIVSNSKKKLSNNRNKKRRAIINTDVAKVKDIEQFLESYEELNIDYMINFPLDHFPSYKEGQEELTNKIELEEEVALPKETATTDTTLDLNNSKKFKRKQTKIRKNKNAEIIPEPK